MIDYNLLNTMFPQRKDAEKWKKYLETVPIPKKPIVTKNDARNTFIKRYFVKASNDNTSIVEVDRAQYYNFSKNPRFATIEISWKIIGKKETSTTPSGIVDRGVEDYNRNQIQQSDLTFGGLSDYIMDYTELWVSEDSTFRKSNVPTRTIEIITEIPPIVTPQVEPTTQQPETNSTGSQGETEPEIFEPFSGRTRAEQLSSENDVLVIVGTPKGNIDTTAPRTTELTLRSNVLDEIPQCESGFLSSRDPRGVCTEYNELKDDIRHKRRISGIMINPYVRNLANPNVNLERERNSIIYNIPWETPYTPPEIEVGFESLVEGYTFTHWRFELVVSERSHNIRLDPRLPDLGGIEIARSSYLSRAGYQTNTSPTGIAFRFWQDAVERRAFFKIPVALYGADIRVSAMVRRDNSDFEALDYPRRSFRDPDTGEDVFFSWQLSRSPPWGPIVLKSKNALIADQTIVPAPYVTRRLDTWGFV